MDNTYSVYLSIYTGSGIQIYKSAVIKVYPFNNMKSSNMCSNVCSLQMMIMIGVVNEYLALYLDVGQLHDTGTLVKQYWIICHYTL